MRVTVGDDAVERALREDRRWLSLSIPDRRHSVENARAIYRRAGGKLTVAQAAARAINEIEQAARRRSHDTGYTIR